MNEPNKDYIINALTNRIAQLSLESAHQAAMLKEAQDELLELKKKYEEHLQQKPDK